MGKTVEDICDLIGKNANFTGVLAVKKHVSKTLSSQIEYCDPSDLFDGFRSVYLNDNSEYKIRKIAREFALAIDKNSVKKVKELKNKYENLKEFTKVKKLLENKAKEVWNVYESIDNTPKEALKVLGITNQPELDFLLDNSLKFYEKDNGNSTAYIISSILNNENMNYTIEDIHRYLVKMHLKQKCKYNFKTIQYLIETQNYTKEKIYELGADKNTIKEALKNISILKRLKLNVKFI